MASKTSFNSKTSTTTKIKDKKYPSTTGNSKRNQYASNLAEVSKSLKLHETKYNRVILNSVRLPDSSEFEENTEVDTSTSINLNSDFASFSSNENNCVSETTTPVDFKGSQQRRRVSCPVSSTFRETRGPSDDFKFLKFDPFDRFIYRLSGKMFFMSNRVEIGPVHQRPIVKAKFV